MTVVNFTAYNGISSGLWNVNGVSGNSTTSGTYSSSNAFNNFNGITAATLTAGTIGNTGAIIIGTYNGPVNGTVGATTPNTGAFTTVTTTGVATINGNLFANSGISSTSTTTGAVTVNGGVGISGNINIGGSRNVVTGNLIPGSNLIYSLGSTTNWWANMYGISVQALYADLAEWYSADKIYEPGTVVDFGGSHEVTLSNGDSSNAVAGVISTNPAYSMNSAITAEFPVAVALTGRVPTKVIGPVKKGQMLVSAGNGYARVENNPRVGTVIGKSLENFDGSSGVIEVVIGKN